MPKPDAQTLDAPIDMPDNLLGAPTAQPEANPAAQAEPEGPADIMDFTFDAFGSTLEPDEPQQKPVQAPAVKKPEPKPEKEPEPEGDRKVDLGDAPESDEPSPTAQPSDLREQVIAANARAREAQKRLDEQREELERIQTERNKFEEKLRTTTDAISRVEASAHPQVTAITAPFEEKLAEFCENLDGHRGNLGNKLRQLAPQLINQRAQLGDPGDPEFEKRQKEFLDTMEQNFGEAQAGRVSDLITEGARVFKKMNAKVAEITSDAERFRYEAQVSDHMKAVKRYEELEKQFGVVPPELRESNPEDARVLLATLMEEIPQLKEREKLVKQHLRRVNLPLAPIDPKQLEGMSEEDQVLHMQERLQRYEADRMQHAAASYEGYVWRMAGPMLAKLVRDMRDRATSAARSTPSPRDNSASQTDTPEEKVLSPADFQIDPNPAGLL